MQKVFYWLATSLQVLLLMGAIAIQVLSTKKMGMMRYVVYMNHQWEAQYPITTLTYLTIAFLSVVAVAIFAYALTKKGNWKKSKNIGLRLAVLALITLVFIFFVLIYSPASYRSYYFTGLFFAIITLLQELKLMVQLVSLH